MNLIWIETHQMDLYVNGNNRRPSYDVIYFDSFRVEQIPKKNKIFIGNKYTITNIYRIQAYDLIKCGHFCIKSIDFILFTDLLIFSAWWYKFNFCWLLWEEE